MVVKIIQFKRGLKKNLPSLAQGEIAFTTDEKRVYIGDDGENIGLMNQNDKAEISSRLADIAFSQVNVKEIKNGATGNANHFNPADNTFYTGKSMINKASDDTESFRRAFNEANDKGSTLIIPEGNYFIQPNALIEVRCPVICLGEIKTLNAGNQYTFILRKDSNNILLQGEDIATEMLSGITNIPEVAEYKGYGLVLNSTEKLIDRDSTEEAFYTKNEPCKILHTGDLEKGLTVDYLDKNALKLTIVPMDRKINVQLKIRTYGLKSENGRTIILNQRSNLILDIFLEDTSQNGHQGLMNLNAFDVYMYGTINGFNLYGTGYGVISSYCYNLHYNMNIGFCRHCIAGRHNRSVFIDGGSYIGDKHAPIDDHWGADYYVRNARITSTRNSSSVFVFAGFGDFIVDGCAIEMENEYLFGVRGDSPHFDGKFEIKNCTINHKAVSGVFVGYKLPTSTKIYKGIPLKNPSVTMKNIVINFNNNASGYKQLLSMSLVSGDRHNAEMPKNVTLEDIKLINCANYVSLIEYQYLDNLRNGNTKLSAKRITVDNDFDLVVRFSIDSKSTVTPSNRFSFDIEGAGNLKISLDSFGVLNSTVSNSTIKQIYPINTGSYKAGSIYDSTPNETVKFIDCVMSVSGLAVFMLFNIEFYRTRFLPTNTAFYTLSGNNMSQLSVKKVDNCKFESGSIANTAIGNLLYNNYFNPNTEVTERNIGYRTNNGVPVGTVVPRYIGEELLDTANKVWYKSVGMSNADWKQVTI